MIKLLGLVTMTRKEYYELCYMSPLIKIGDNEVKLNENLPVIKIFGRKSSKDWVEINTNKK